jgi:hypothetical protein
VESSTAGPKQQSTLTFQDGGLRFRGTALEEIKERQDDGLVFYSFNPRMIPDNVFSRPVFRKLMPRTAEEVTAHQ